MKVKERKYAFYFNKCIQLRNLYMYVQRDNEPTQIILMFIASMSKQNSF